jgi:formate hydrogenlyase subunit 6/NADH:ubiquinone oxidoreductase subunit I
MAKKYKLSPMFGEVLGHVFKKPATGKYPFVKCVPAEGFRGQQVFDITLCVACGLCSRDCPAKAIEMVDVEGKKRPMFFLDRCIFCYQCAESCPRNAIKATVFFELATTDKASLIMIPKAPESAPKPAEKPAEAKP